MPQYSYTAYFEPNEEGGYSVVFPAIPEIITFGSTLEEAKAMAADALRCHLEGLLKDGEPLPQPKQVVGHPVKEEVAVTL